MKQHFGFLAIVLSCVCGSLSCRNRADTHLYHYTGHAMFPTVSTNDYLVVEAGSGKIRRGDIVVFHTPGMAASNISATRVVGIEQDVIDVVSGRLRVNGHEIRYSLAQTNISLGAEAYQVEQDRTFHRPAISSCPVVVPSRHVFVVGDNPHASFDSRYWGSLSTTNIFGRVIGKR